MNNLGRNDPCWCQSGKKYKKCHLNRDRQQKDNPRRAVEANKKAFNKKKCCAQGGMLGACGGNVIRAHTVSHGPNLSKISRNGKVIQYCVNKNGGKLVASEIGTRNASVFYGFCAQHDQALFSCIENKDFVGRPNQCLAVAYRTLSRELYGKDASGHLRETLRGADKGKSLFEQVFVQKMLDVVDCGNEASRKELKVTHDKLTQALADGRADVLRSLVIEFDGELPFMLAGAWSPLTDFFGRGYPFRSPDPKIWWCQRNRITRSGARIIRGHSWNLTSGSSRRLIVRTSSVAFGGLKGSTVPGAVLPEDGRRAGGCFDARVVPGRPPSQRGLSLRAPASRYGCGSKRCGTSPTRSTG